MNAIIITPHPIHAFTKHKQEEIIMNLKENIINAKTAKEAKAIKQYGVSDTYELIKSGNLFIVKVDGIAIGAATSEKDAKAMVELLSHYTNGNPLNKDTVMGAGYRMTYALREADSIAEAGAEAISIQRTYDIKGETYVVAEDGEVYPAHTTSGESICNVTDLIKAGLSDDFIIKHIIASIDEQR